MSNAVRSSQTVLILGHPDDVVTQAFLESAHAAGHQVHLSPVVHHTSPLQPVLPPGHVPQVIVVTSLMPDPVHLLTQLELTPGQLILFACLAQTALETASALPHPSQMVGFSGLALYQGRDVLELCPTLHTDPFTFKKASHFLEQLGWQVYAVQDSAGLILPRVLACLVNEAASALMEGVASAEDIDTAMQLGTNYPQGPLAWADAVGLDVILGILENLHTVYREDRYRPMPLLQDLALAGKLGRKTGEGFYVYHPDPDPVCA